MKYSLVAGENAEIRYDFDGAPIVPTPGYPIVTILDQNDAEISVFQSVQDGADWVAVVTIPDVEAIDSLIYTAKWLVVDQDQNTTTASFPIIIAPNVKTGVGDVVLLEGITQLKFMVQGLVDSADVSINIYLFNDLVGIAQATSHTQLFDRTEIVVDNIPVLEPSISPYLVAVDMTMMFNLWVVTPTMLGATTAIEAWVNKAQIQQVIPQLEYTQADLLRYLERGLNLFNSYMPQLTAFNGLNMKGILHEMWLLCGTYYALGAQLQAEGALAFDFSGQAVTLNVDRTPSIEAALSRIESMMNEKIPQTKRLLARHGVRSGSGANGTLIGTNPTGLGRLTITSGASIVGSAHAVGRPYSRY